MCNDCIERGNQYSLAQLMIDMQIRGMIDGLHAAATGEGTQAAMSETVALLDHLKIKDRPPNANPPPNPPIVQNIPQAEFYMSAVRKAFFEHYCLKKQVPTAKMLWRSVKNSTKYKGSAKELRKMVEQAGYRVRLNNKKTPRSKGQPHASAFANLPGVAKLKPEVD